MGGSLALAAKQAGAVGTVIGWSRRETTLQAALAAGVIDVAEQDLATALQTADCVVVATPTILAESLMVKVLEQVPASVVVTDVASVKGNIANALIDRFGQMPANAVLGHPIAGSEQSGVAAARADLYQDHHVILVNDPATDVAALQKVNQLWQAVGAEVFEMSAEDHDHVLALTSHLPHLLAYALVAQLTHNDKSMDVFKYAAGGLRDFTRIASSDPVMWREILLANKDQLRHSIEGFQHQLALLATLLEDGEGEVLESIFTDVKHSRDEFAAALALRNKS